MNFPESAALAACALTASGHATHAAFCAEYGCGLRNFRRWLAGENKMDGLTAMVMGQIAKGWHPTL